MKLPQLTLRELFLFVALVAMGCGWWHSHRNEVDLSVVRSMMDALETNPNIPSIGGALHTGKGEIILVELSRPEP